jgi:hypothetical protein
VERLDLDREERLGLSKVPGSRAPLAEMMQGFQWRLGLSPVTDTKARDLCFEITVRILVYSRDGPSYVLAVRGLSDALVARL